MEETMTKRDYQELARACRNGMNIEEAIKIVEAQPTSPDKSAFWNELNNPRTTMSVFKDTKMKLRALKRKEETYDDLLNRLVGESNAHKNQQ